MIWHPNLEWYYEFEKSVESDSSANSRDITTLGKLKMEAGSVTLSSSIDDGVVVSVNFQNTYADPIVLAYLPIMNGGEYIVPRVRNITTTGCDIFQEEPDNGTHGSQVCHYLVVEKGVHYLPRGGILEVGSITTSTVHRSGDTPSGDPVSFSKTYTDPTILHFIQTRNSGDFAASFCTNLTTTGAELGIAMLQTGLTAGTEEIGYIVLDRGDATEDSNIIDLNGVGIKFEQSHALQGSNSGFGDTAYTFSFVNTYSVNPLIIVSGHTVNGADGWTPRGNTLSTTNHSMYSDEDQIGDVERNHAAEEISWVVFSEAFVYNEEVIRVNEHVSKSAKITPNSYAMIPHSHDTVGEIGDMTVFFKGTIDTPNSSQEDFSVVGYDRSEYWTIGCGRTTSATEEDFLSLSVVGETTGVVDVISTTVLNDNVPHFCAATYKKSTGVVTLYMDGVEVHSEQVLNAGEDIGSGNPSDGMLFTLAESSNGDRVRLTRGYNATLDSIGYINGTCLELPDIERLRLGLSPLKV